MRREKRKQDGRAGTCILVGGKARQDEARQFLLRYNLFDCLPQIRATDARVDLTSGYGRL